jgi:hypothetical protein
VNKGEALHFKAGRSGGSSARAVGPNHRRNRVTTTLFPTLIAPSQERTGGPEFLGELDKTSDTASPCPRDMVSIDDAYCIDRFEASLVELLPDGKEQPWPHYMPIEGHIVRAVSEPRVFPQAYISEVQAVEACARSEKRLCKANEWRKACMGPERTTYPYGSANEPRRCNDHGRSPMGIRWGLTGDESDRAQWTWDKMNDPSLDQYDGTLAKAGDHERCTNAYGAFDMVGNLHEWIDDPSGTFLGGYYQDIHLNGDGCAYKTMAHEAAYHDYSTGFRCCADADPEAL